MSFGSLRVISFIALALQVGLPVPFATLLDSLLHRGNSPLPIRSNTNIVQAAAVH